MTSLALMARKSINTFRRTSHDLQHKSVAKKKFGSGEATEAAPPELLKHARTQPRPRPPHVEQHQHQRPPHNNAPRKIE